MRRVLPFVFVPILFIALGLPSVAHAKERRFGVGLDVTADAVHIQLELRPIKQLGLQFGVGRTIQPYFLSTIVGGRVYLAQKKWVAVFVGGTFVRQFSPDVGIRSALEDTFTLNSWTRDSWFVGPTVGITLGKGRGFGLSFDVEQLLNPSTGKSLGMTGLRLDWAF